MAVPGQTGSGGPAPIALFLLPSSVRMVKTSNLQVGNADFSSIYSYSQCPALSSQHRSSSSWNQSAISL